MASKDVSEEDKRLGFLWKIGIKYAKTAPELSRYYFFKYQQLQQDNKSFLYKHNICYYCGNLFLDSNSKTRILKKISMNKKKVMKKHQNKSEEPFSQRRKKSTISTSCFVCKKTTFCDGSEKKVRRKEKKGKEVEETSAFPVNTIQTKLPENYSSLSASAKKKWRNKIRINKLKLQEGFSPWQSDKKTKDENKATGLMAFLSALEK